MVKRKFLIVTDDSILGQSMQDAFENKRHRTLLGIIAVIGVEQGYERAILPAHG